MTWQAVRAHLDNQAVNTARAYRAALRIWCEFLRVEEMSIAGATAITEATPLDAMRWVEALRKRKGQTARFGGHSRASAGTIARRVAAMRSIYNALIDAQIVVKNPFEIPSLRKLEKDKTQKRPTTILQFEQVRALIAEPSAHTKEGKRDRAVLALLFGGALRREEVRNLLISHLDFSKHGLTLRLLNTKNGDDALQPVAAFAVPFIKALYEQRIAECRSRNEPLVTEYYSLLNCSSGRTLCDKGIYRIFKYWCEQSGLGPEFTPHSARATAITYLAERGVPHRSIAAFSRHSSIQMVEKYDKLRGKAGSAAVNALDFSDVGEKDLANKHDVD